MGNIISYVREKGFLGFDELAFSEVDSLVLSQLSYMKYDAFELEGPHGMSFDELYAQKNRDTLFEKTRTPEQNTALFHAVAKSKRFRDVRLCMYENKLEKSSELQFSAITFVIRDLFSYIAFRGTDDTLVGWKEDFNMTFMPIVPAQLEALSYLCRVSELVCGRMVLGGHSKGGNLAVYSAFSASEDIRARIDRIYNHDGPGFLGMVLENENYLSLKNIISKTVPRSSYFGMMFAQKEDYRIVESNRIGIMQHDPFSWKVEEGDFVTLEELSSSSTYMDNTINDWVEKMTFEERKVFVDALFSVLDATEAEYFSDMGDDMRKTASAVLKSMKSLDKNTRKAVRSALSAFFKSAGREAKAGVLSLRTSQEN